MVTSSATTVAEYLRSLPADRRRDISKVRALVRKHLPKGFKECVQCGVIAWVIPLTRYPVTYNKQPLVIVSLASQKNYASLYLMGLYSNPSELKAFERAYRDGGKKLNMGKSCVRFRSVEELATEVIIDSLKRVSVDAFIAAYERSRATKESTVGR